MNVGEGNPIINPEGFPPDPTKSANSRATPAQQDAMKNMAEILKGAPASPAASLELHKAAELDALGQTDEVNLDEAMRLASGSPSATTNMPEVVDLEAEVDAELLEESKLESSSGSPAASVSNSQSPATKARDMTATYFEDRASLGEPVTSAGQGQSASSSGSVARTASESEGSQPVRDRSRSRSDSLGESSNLKMEESAETEPKALTRGQRAKAKLHRIGSRIKTAAKDLFAKISCSCSRSGEVNSPAVTATRTTSLEGRKCTVVSAEQMYGGPAIASPRGFKGTAEHSTPDDQKIASDQRRFEANKEKEPLKGKTYEEISKDKCCDLAMVNKDKGFMAIVDIHGHAEPTKRAQFEPIFDDLSKKVDEDKAGEWANAARDPSDDIGQENCYVCAKFGKLDGKNGVYTGQCGDVGVFIVDKNNKLVRVPNNEEKNLLTRGEGGIVKRFIELKSSDKGVLCFTDGTIDFFTPDEISELLIASDYDKDRFLELSLKKKQEKSQGVEWDERGYPVIQEGPPKIMWDRAKSSRPHFEDGTYPYNTNQKQYSDDASIAFMETPIEFRGIREK